MIKSISFKNYKIFKEKQSLELKPITVLIGKNNTGKSAVAKLPVIVEAGLKSEIADALTLQIDGIDLGGELRDLVYGKANRALELNIEYIENDELNKLSLAVLVMQEKKKQHAKIDFWQLNEEIRLQYEGVKDLYVDELSETRYNCEFLGFHLANYFEAKRMDSSGTLLRQYANLLTDYIGPIRDIPVRDYRLSSLTNSKFGFLGQNTYQYLIEDALTTEKKLISEVSKWYNDNFEGWGIRINQDRSPIYQIEIERNEIRQNIKDAGMGINQALPLVTRAIKPCEEETLLIYEEPESHLHPAAHGNLAELFVKSLEQGNKRYLIETHSQNFVLRLRRLVAERKLQTSDLAIYYVNFNEEKNYSVLEKIEVAEGGNVNKWPEGIFSETLIETVAMRTAQLDKSKYADRN